MSIYCRRIHGFTQTKNDLVDLQKDLARNIRACSTPMDPRILLLATVCLGVAIAAPMAMRDIQSKFKYVPMSILKFYSY